MVVVEVTRKAYLASLVPVIVDAVLNEHQVVADIVAFVSNGDFPRSRLGEKQRGKVLASWVTRKLRTIAQFSIRDVEDNPFAVIPQHRASRSSQPGSTMGNSLRRSNVNPETDVPAVPPSPAAVVPGEALDVAPTAYQEPNESQDTLAELDSRTTSHVSATPIVGATSSVPRIQEPLSATTHSADHEQEQSEAVTPQPPPATNMAEPGSNRDFRFSFDVINTPMASQPGSVPLVTEQISTGRGSLPSEQPASATAHAITSSAQDEKPRPGTQESGLMDDWPQEALMYHQNSMGSEEDRGVSRPGASTQQRYNGSGY